MTIAVARTGETRSAGSKKYRNARKKPHTASARPTRCTAARATPTASGRPPSWGPNGALFDRCTKSAPYMLTIPWTATLMACGRWCAGASFADATGVTWYPCRTLISRTASSATANDKTLAATRDSSYHWEARGLRCLSDGEQDAGGAHNGERHGRGEQGHPVRDHHPGEHHADRDRDVPAPRRPVQHQEHQQQRERGAQMIRLGEHQVRVVAELRRDHDPGRHREADQPFPPRRTAPGQQPGRQHQQRIGGGTRDVHVIRAQAAEQLDQRVFGNLGRVVRHVPEGPAAQQPVPVQHVPALQRLVRAVRGSRIRPGQPQVDEEQDDGHQDRAGKPHPPGKAAPRCFPCRLLSGNASSRVLRGTLARRTGETSDHAQTLAEARAPSLFLPSVTTT